MRQYFSAQNLKPLYNIVLMAEVLDVQTPPMETGSAPSWLEIHHEFLRHLPTAKREFFSLVAQMSTDYLPQSLQNRAFDWLVARSPLEAMKRIGSQIAEALDPELYEAYMFTRYFEDAAQEITKDPAEKAAERTPALKLGLLGWFTVIPDRYRESLIASYKQGDVNTLMSEFRHVNPSRADTVTYVGRICTAANIIAQALAYEDFDPERFEELLKRQAEAIKVARERFLKSASPKV